uniref:Uncharacterized protein n=1 Tax=Knipowitschia caucasica TaxID=637954 RepID=A0AAV2MK68_KNICA
MGLGRGVNVMRVVEWGRWGWWGGRDWGGWVELDGVGGGGCIKVGGGGVVDVVWRDVGWCCFWWVDV